MNDKKIKESLLIAEELAKELCTGKPSTSLLTKQWKEQHPEQAQRIKAQDGLSEEIDFHDSIDTEEALAHVSRRIVFARKNLRYLFIGIAASLLLVTGFSALWMQTDETRKGDEWISAAPEAPLTTIATPDGAQVELGEKDSR